MFPSAHVDPFTRDRLPPLADWPTLLLDRPEHQYPAQLNCVSELLDARRTPEWGARPCFIGANTTWSYAETAAMVDRIAHVLVDRLGLVPGQRVLLRAPNSPMLAATYLAIMKAGGVVVATMPLLRAAELRPVVAKAQVHLALCDPRLVDALTDIRDEDSALQRIVTFGDADGELESYLPSAPEHFTACPTASDDVCLLGFTSGTTGTPKATMHFHRDVLAIARAYGAHVLRAHADDRFIGSPPLAFTFGLGGLVIFPLAVGASSVLLERLPPDELLTAIARHRATITFTAPTAYRAMAAKARDHDLSSLRVCVSAGETLPKATLDAWHDATGITLQDGIGATELLHIFIGSPVDQVRPGATGRVVPGYEARIVDTDGHVLPDGTAGHLEVRGPTGCRYLDDERQRAYVRNGWNRTGDTFLRDADGYFWYQARSDDMITASGYAIAGPEVEQALLLHPAVAECAVVGAVHEDRTTTVAAYVVLRDGIAADDGLTRALQEHVKSTIAPYKYPRIVRYLDALPKTPTGKVQRSVLRQWG
ncbi:MAG: AMP-binding protein [Gemmatimonadaceae bacterium]|nr:AMP-binding protein [Gemmatimonadaceae bacterium]